MRCSLAFWKYEDGVYLDNQLVYENTIAEGKLIEGLQMLPINKIREKIKDDFSDWDWLDEDNFEYESRRAVQIQITEQAVQFDCYSVSQDDMNKLIDVMLAFGCPLYDPQIAIRFDGVS